MGAAEATAGVMYVFRVGSPSGAAAGSVYVGQVEGAEPSVQRAPSERRGLELLKEAAAGLALSCEPALASAAGGLGLATGPLPPFALKTRAVFAYAVSRNLPLGKPMQEAIGAYLNGAAVFGAALSWDAVGPDERLHVVLSEGDAEKHAELSVVGGDGIRLPGLALCDSSDALQELAEVDGEAWTETLLQYATLTVDMERDPAWVAEIIEEGFGLTRVPLAASKREGGKASVRPQDLLVAGALLEAVGAMVKLRDKAAVGEGKAEGAGSRVQVRLGRADQPKVMQALVPPAAAPAEEKPQEPAPEAAEAKPVEAPGAATAPKEPAAPAVGEEARPAAPSVADVSGAARATPVPPGAIARPEAHVAKASGEKAKPGAARVVVPWAIPGAPVTPVAVTPELLAEVRRAAEAPVALASLGEPGPGAAEALAGEAKPVAAQAVEMPPATSGTSVEPRPPAPEPVVEAPRVAEPPIPLVAVVEPEPQAAEAVAEKEKPGATVEAPPEAPAPSVEAKTPAPEPVVEAPRAVEMPIPLVAVVEPAPQAAEAVAEKEKPGETIEVPPAAPTTSVEPAPPAPEAASEEAKPGALRTIDLLAAIEDASRAPGGVAAVQEPVPAEVPAQVRPDEKAEAAAPRSAAPAESAPEIPATEPPADVPDSAILQAAPPVASEPKAEPAPVRPAAVVTLTPVREPVSAPPPATPAPSEGATEIEEEAGRESWLARIGRLLHRKPAQVRSRPAPPAAKPVAPPAPLARPEPPAEENADPFAPFARALRVPVPMAPAPRTAEEEAALEAIAARLTAAAEEAAGELVSFPAVALQIIERVHDPKADARSVGGFIARDPALAADVVKIANSAAYRGVSEIESVHQAVARLGLIEVGRVASAVAARTLLDAPGGEGASTGLFVRAVAVATAASSAALRQRGARSDHVWLGGLLHDVGRALGPPLFTRLAKQPGDQLTSVALVPLAIERVHAAVGAAAIRQWGLPGYLLELCAHHHDDEIPAEAVDLHLVRLTSALAKLSEPASAARAAREIVQSAAALHLGPAAVRALATDLKEAETRAKGWAR